jgi:copper transport protein
VIPGVAGHAAQTSPRGLAVALDWLHVGAGSLWLGGLTGLLVLWGSSAAAIRPSVLALGVPRFSNVALVSVLVLLGSGIWASVLHLPLLSALWTTRYGQLILVKSGLLALAVAAAAVNLLRTKPRLVAAGARATGAVAELRTTVSVEVLIVAGAILAASILSSLAPPSKYLSQEGKALAKVGPGPVASVVTQGPYTLKVLVQPNKAAAPNRFALGITKNGRPVTGADVTVTFAMLDMQMGNQQFQLAETAPGVYSRPAAALVMVGHWGLTFAVTPRAGAPFTAVVVDRANG